VLSYSTPEQCPSVVALLCESFNAHVRYGAAMALGIACAATGLKVGCVCVCVHLRTVYHVYDFAFASIFVRVVEVCAFVHDNIRRGITHCRKQFHLLSL
jgi:hypothetical protein